MVPSTILFQTSTLFLAAHALVIPSRRQATSDKLVVAHHIVGNTFSYAVQDWASDIALAKASGIDGFALNIGKEDFEQARVSDAFTAASQPGSDFKLFLSLDMSSLPCATEADGQSLRSIVLAHAGDANHLQINQRALVSTFAGELGCTFGQASVAEGWRTQFAQHPDLQGKITFVPSFFVDPATFGDFQGVMDGDYNFNSGWPIQVTTAFAQGLGGNESISTPGNTVLTPFIGSFDTDNQHLSALAALNLANPVYMAAVSPWFFTHFGADSFNKNFIFLADQHLYVRRWETLIANRDKIPIVEINTFNDFGESHYIGPIHGDLPTGSEAWVNGFDHTAWLTLTQYYATAFKTGQFPTLQNDTIVMWSRTHPGAAQSSDPVGAPTNFELAEDAVWAVVLAKEPATVTLTTNEASSQTFDVPAGASKLFVPISAGDSMKATLSRNGGTVLELSPEGFVFNGTPPNFNFNALVVQATA